MCDSSILRSSFARATTLKIVHYVPTSPLTRSWMIVNDSLRAWTLVLKNKRAVRGMKCLMRRRDDVGFVGDSSILRSSFARATTLKMMHYVPTSPYTRLWMTMDDSLRACS